MNPQGENELRQFLATFDVSALGNGDPVAGTTALVSMAVTLANLAKPGSGVRTPHHDLLRVGASVLVSGPLGCGRVLDEVVTELGIRQNNLTAHLRRQSEVKAALDGQPGPKTRVYPRGPKANSSEAALWDLQNAESFDPATVEQRWAAVVSHPPNPRIGDLAARPKLIVTANRPAGLEKQLCGLHGGRPLVILGLHRPEDLAGWGDLCPALIDGLLPVGTSGETVNGNLLVTDPAGVLQEVAGGAGAWLDRVLWLVEGNAGPEIPVAGSVKPGVVLNAVAERFRQALSLAFGLRLNNHDQTPTVMESDLARAQRDWIGFLKGMEATLPGISGTARNLLATLTFGLRQLVTAWQPPKGFAWSVPGIEALARLLVRRMADAREAMLFTAEEARRRRCRQRIRRKLDDGRPLDERTIYRHLELSADECREGLSALEADGEARRVGRDNMWQRVTGTSCSANGSRPSAPEA